MVRIYFEKQIFSALFKGEDIVYQNLLSDLYHNKFNFLYCYSFAHIEDLKNDLTDIKFQELRFMETLVEDNYLLHNYTEDKTSSYLVTPIMAFEEAKGNIEFSFSNPFLDLLDDESDDFTTEQRKQLDLISNIFTNQKINFASFDFSHLPPKIFELLSKVFPEKKSYSIFECAQNIFHLAESLKKDQKFYKELRLLVDEQINIDQNRNESFPINFNLEMKNSPLKKTFIEIVENQLNTSGAVSKSEYSFFTLAYLFLDLLGISKEPSRKVKFNNVIADGDHSYYGAFCDYVVSNDIGFLKKTKLLYNLLNIQTRVMTVDEFVLQFKELTKNVEKDIPTFIQLIRYDLKNALIVDTKKSIKYNRTTTTFKCHTTYLGHFDRLDYVLENDNTYVFLSQFVKNKSNSTFFREIQRVVNNANRLFGHDKYYKHEYDWDIENKEIELKQWSGRYWEIEEATFFLTLNEGTGRLSFQICFD